MIDISKPEVMCTNAGLMRQGIVEAVEMAKARLLLTLQFLVLS